MDVVLSVSSHKHYFHTEATVLVIVGLRKGGSPAPGIYHIGIAFLSGQIQHLCQAFVCLRIPIKTEDMTVKASNA